MSPLAFDTETNLIRPALLAPSMVCLTYQERGQDAAICHHTDAHRLIQMFLADCKYVLVGHNVSYDLAVICARYPDLIPAVFQACKNDRVTDTIVRQQLLDTAAGIYRGGGSRQKYTLETLAKRCAGIELQKDGWRLSYGAFLDVPLSGWIERAKEVQAEARPRAAALSDRIAGLPKDAPKSDRKALQAELDGLNEMIASDPGQCLKYPLDDARATLAVYEAQERHVRFLADQYRQTRAAFALHLSSCWGIRTDAHGVEVLRRETQAELDEVEEILVEAGLVRDDKSRTRDTKAAKARMIRICREFDRKLPLTDAHRYKNGVAKCTVEDCEEHVSLDAEACEESEDPLLENYAKLTTLKKVLSNDVAAIEKGIVYPCHTRYGFAATGRSTSSKPNIQNVSRRPGLREAFVPRAGWLFAENDYPQLELYTLAQCCVAWFGASKLAEALRSGLDPHTWVAAQICQIAYDDALAILKDSAHPRRKEVKRARDLAKVANFGFPGGLGIDSFIAFARGSMSRAQFLALELTPQRVKDLKANWLKAWPEMVPYFARANAACANANRRGQVWSLFTDRFRGDTTYCQTCNTPFQGLGADCAKAAGWLIAEAQYTDRGSPLYGSRTVAFVHDEYIVEVRDDSTAHDAAIELARLMMVGANQFLPDVPIVMGKMSPLLMRRWSKAAEATFDASGRLVPWVAA